MTAIEAQLRREIGVESVLQSLQNDPLFWKAKQAVKEEVIKPQRGPVDIASAVAEALQGSSLLSELKTAAHDRARQLRHRQRLFRRVSEPQLPLPPLPVPAEQLATLDAVEWARRRWAELAMHRLRDLSEEQGQAFLRPRAGGAAAGGGGATGSGSQPATEPEEVSTRHVLDLDGLYMLVTDELREHVASRRAPGMAGSRRPPLPSWSQLGVQLHAEPLEVLRVRYQELRPELSHLGLPTSAQSALAAAELLEKRQREGQQLLRRAYAPELQVFARLGVPPGLRQAVWASCLPPAGTGASVGTVGAHGGCFAGAEDLQEVIQGVGDWEWLTDDVLRLDVAEHCANDISYFPFDEIAEAMVLMLSRDAGVPRDCDAGPPQQPLVAGTEAEASFAAALAEGSGAPPPQTFVPPCGVVPFCGFSRYACPFAFLADKLEIAYPLFRAFYCRHLSKLHTISCQPATLLSLCSLYESLVFTLVPHVCLHLSQLGPEAAPLRVAFPWIVFGFVGVLRAEQVLVLWDRIVGFGSVELVAVLAAAVFVFRERLLLGARSAQDVELAFADLSALCTMPLLQGFLFASELTGPFDA